jgi:solute carrier family 25 carnitine/acylcarnitine transporter 20/29
MFCGTISGGGNCVSGYLFDTLKVRMQMDPSLTMTKAFIDTFKSKGFTQFFSGIYYPLITVPIINAIIFSSYELYKKIRNKNELTFLDGI